MSVGANLFEFALPTRIVFGTGALVRLAKLPMPGKKTLLVTTSGGSLVRSGLLDRVKALFAARGVEIVLFDRVFPNPTDTLVMEASALARSEGVDFVTGLGGGSALDVAKAIAMTAVNEGDVWDYVRGGTGGGKSPAHPSLPTLLIPTTAGTGSEADPWIVLGKLETDEKIAFGNRGTYPTMSVVDPSLTLSVPPFLTACQGFDALCHAAEGYLNRRASPVSDLFALEAVRLLGRSLVTAVRKGDDLAARSDVSLAATLAGVNESLAGCISLHALEHALSAKNPNLTHGQGLAMLAFAYFRHLINKGAAHERFVDLARALGYPRAAAPADFLAVLHHLLIACGLANLSWREAGFSKKDFPDLIDNARSAMGALFRCDPEELSDGDLFEILECAWWD